MFDSCSAYQDSRPHILFLSHCVPSPPNKGEKIRAHHELRALCEKYRVHLACFARSRAEIAEAEALSSVCASVYAELFSSKKALLQAGVKFSLGGCLNQAYYSSRRLRDHVVEVARRVRISASFVYTAVMTPYAPANIPIILDMVDVDSEKWFDYATSRIPGFAYKIEGSRLQQFEAECAMRSSITIVVTSNEADVLRRHISDRPILAVENGVDTEYFDGRSRPLPDGSQRRFVVFVGTMDYRPNIDAAIWFATEAFLELRRRVPDLEFLIVGRNPANCVRELKRLEGVYVTGAVPDVRPYLSQANAVVAPLTIARGIQNKVLEALAMGRHVFASDAVCRTFGAKQPVGLVRCDSKRHLLDSVEGHVRNPPRCDDRIREASRERFSWTRNMARLCEQVDLVHFKQPASQAGFVSLGARAV